MEVKFEQTSQIEVQQKCFDHCGPAVGHCLSIAFQLISTFFIISAICALLVQLVFQLVIRSGLNKVKPSADDFDLDEMPLSVIIVARDEESNLRRNLPSVLASQYSNFEVVLVDDYSSDRTKLVMEEFASIDKRVKVVVNKEAFPGKKGALNIGIEAASNEYLVFTDADCKLDKEWLRHFAVAYASGGDFVVGHGAYDRGTSWFSEFYAFEAHRSAMLYFAAAAQAAPYMCVGRSMGYSKSLFNKSEGFKPFKHIQSGSDDLFLQSVKGVARISLVPSAVTYSLSPSSIKRWMVQRKRHLGAGKHYPFNILLMIFLYEITNLLIPLAYLFLLFTKSEHIPLLTFLVIIRILLFRSNAQIFSGLIRSNDDISQLWWTEYPMSWLNALISMNIGLMKKEAWTTRR